jgi:XRE family transcriptional regulator, regulator of sulfur utilization
MRSIKLTRLYSILDNLVNPLPVTSSGLGEQLRALRRARGLALAEVAAGTKISRSFLSLLEAGKSDITVGRLMRLVDFYGVSVSELLPEASSTDPVTVARNGERRLLASPSEGIQDYLLTPDAKRAMLPFVGVFEPGGKNAEYAEHEGEEFAYVLKGSFTLQVDGRDPILLNEEDSVYFPAHLPHCYANVTNGQSRLLCVVTPPHI